MQVQTASVNEIVSGLLAQVETRRQRELAKALNMMGKVDDEKKKIISNLTSAILMKALQPVVENFRAEADNDELIAVATKLLALK